MRTKQHTLEHIGELNAMEGTQAAKKQTIRDLGIDARDNPLWDLEAWDWDPQRKWYIYL